MKKIIIIVLILLLLIGLYGCYIGTYGFVINDNKLVIYDIPDSFTNFKIIQFSDTLINNDQDINNLNNIVNTINELKPDIIVFTGDLFSNNYEINNKDKIISILKKLEPNLFKYAIFGDNDLIIKDTYIEIMKNSNFILLSDESSYIFYKDISPIQIIGLTNTNNIEQAIKQEDGITPIYKILLTHYPDNIDNISNYDINLILAGHSLKGQIRLPFYGGIIRKNGAKKYIDSYYEINNTKMYVSGGLGTEKIPFRLFNKPEINIYSIEK